MSVISELRAVQRRLSAGDKVVVYVPFQVTDEDGRPMWPYWEGTVVSSNLGSKSALAFYIRRGDDTDDHLFHHTFCFPERLRGKVRFTPSHRLRIVP